MTKLEKIRNDLVEICAMFPRGFIEAAVDRLEHRPPGLKHPTANEKAVALLVLLDGYKVKAAAKVLNRSAMVGHKLLRSYCRWANPECFAAGQYDITNGFVDYTGALRTNGPELTYLREHARDFLRPILR